MSETATQSHVSGLAADTDQFLTFTIEDEEYGIEILRVQEIKDTSFFRGMGKVGEKLVLLLNIDRLVNDRSYQDSIAS